MELSKYKQQRDATALETLEPVCMTLSMHRMKR